jgi:Uma2 family endonuclease
MFNFPKVPLPPLLARLHELLEAHAEETEEGVLIIEQDRRVSPGAGPGTAALLPVIMFVPAKPRPDAKEGRVAPELIVEVLGAPGGPSREERYARAGVREYWRVEPAPTGPPRIVVLQDPDAATSRFRRSSEHVGGDPVVSSIMPRLRLAPADLV